MKFNSKYFELSKNSIISCFETCYQYNKMDLFKDILYYYLNYTLLKIDYSFKNLKVYELSNKPDSYYINQQILSFKNQKNECVSYIIQFLLKKEKYNILNQLELVNFKFLLN